MPYLHQKLMTLPANLPVLAFALRVLVYSTSFSIQNPSLVTLPSLSLRFRIEEVSYQFVIEFL